MAVLAPVHGGQAFASDLMITRPPILFRRMHSTDECSVRTRHEGIVGRPGRRREAKTIDT